jgi:hypothetical protein
LFFFRYFDQNFRFVFEKSKSVVNLKEALSSNNNLKFSFSLTSMFEEYAIFDHLYDLNKCHYMTSLSKSSLLNNILKAFQNRLDVFGDECFSFSANSAHKPNRLFLLNMIINAEYNQNMRNKSSMEFKSLHSSTGKFVSFYLFILLKKSTLKCFIYWNRAFKQHSN